MDFSTTLIHCSSIGKLMTEPKLKKEKEAGNLSETAKTHLREVYAKAKYGREKDIETLAMLKGTTVEEDGITLLSRYDKVMYKKNIETLSNGYIIGTPDIRYRIAHASGYSWTTIKDTKCSWDIFSFLKHLGEDMEDIYYWQLQGYMWLDNGDAGEVARCLVDTPEFIIESHLRSLKYKTPESEHQYVEQELRKNFTYPDIQLREKVIKHTVSRNQADIDLIPGKVIKAREYLQYLDTLQTFNVLQTELK